MIRHIKRLLPLALEDGAGCCSALLTCFEARTRCQLQIVYSVNRFVYYIIRY